MAKIASRASTMVKGYEKRIKEKQALKRAQEMTRKWAAEDAAKKKKPKPKPKKTLPKATEAGGTALEEGRRMGIYKKKKKKKKTQSKVTQPGGSWYKP